MSELFTLIKNRQMNDAKSVEELCEKFFPLIKKYARKLNYEDSYNNLQLCFIECILKIPLNSGKFILSDVYILSYIKKAIYFGYIALSKRIENYSYKNILYESYEFFIEKVSYKENLSFFEDELFKTDIGKILNEKEFKICVLKFIERFTDAEIAEQYNVSRQAINKTINKIKKKLYSYYRN